MASRGRPQALPRESRGDWTPEQAAEFAARRDFRLLQLLSGDCRAEAAARRLGLFGAPTTKVSLKSAGTQKSQGTTAPSKASPASSQGSPDRSQRPPNSAQRRAKRRAEKYYQEKFMSGSQPSAPAKPLNPAAPEFKPPDQRVEVDATAGGEAPASPRQEQERLLLAASESLAAKQKQRKAAQRLANRIHRVDSTRRGRGRGAKGPS